MAQVPFSHDAFGTMMPYLDAVSRARMPETSREGVGNHELCRPSASVFRAHKVNGTCPPYATTVNPNTDCCENIYDTVNNTNPSDVEFLNALKHGYQFNTSPSTFAVTSALNKVAPDIGDWIDNRHHFLAAVAAPPTPPLTLNVTRGWFDLVMKFYILLRPNFTIRAHDPVTNTTLTVFTNFKVYLVVGNTFRNRLVRCIQEVGAMAVQEHYSMVAAFVPNPRRCRNYIFKGFHYPVVDITDMARVVSNPLCGLRGKCSMKFNSVAAVSEGTSWVDTLVDIFLAMSNRGDIEYFYLLLHHTSAGNVNVPANMTVLPGASGLIADAQQYRPVVDNLTAMLPGAWQVHEVPYNANPQRWNNVWMVTSNSYDYRFELKVMQRGVLSMTFEVPEV